MCVSVCLQLNVSFPATGCQKLFEVVDEHKLRVFYEKRMGQVVEADILGDEWKGYQLRIAGGNDKQGFPMKQGVLTHGELSGRLILRDLRRLGGCRPYKHCLLKLYQHWLVANYGGYLKRTFCWTLKSS